MFNLVKIPFILSYVPLVVSLAAIVWLIKARRLSPSASVAIPVVRINRTYIPTP